jgi:hypothetical protein
MLMTMLFLLFSSQKTNEKQLNGLLFSFATINQYLPEKLALIRCAR